MPKGIYDHTKRNQRTHKPITWKEQICIYSELGNCYICTSHKNKDADGYPMIEINRRRIHMSRYIYEQVYGKIPEGKIIRHRCDTPECIRLEHFEIGEPLDNTHDMIKRGRNNPAKGEKHHNAKLTKEIVNVIRTNTIISGRQLAQIYNISPSTVSVVKNYKGWCNDIC
jgi:hypothetical protein